MTFAPDYVEPVRAWRTWLVVQADGTPTLRSVLFPTAWHPAEPAVAECLRPPSMLDRLRRRSHLHSAPGSRCACGIHGATRDTATGYLRAPASCGREVVGTVVGVMSLWGTIVESDGGSRASRAYPARLFVRALRTSPETLVEELGAYGIPVDLLDGGSGPELSAALAPFDPLR